eukprot:1913067-Ditylum_brightwellii.AAC.3
MSKQNKHVICDKDNDVNNDVDCCDDDSADDSDGGGVDDGDDMADKHLTHLSQQADYCLIERIKKNKHDDCNEDDHDHEYVDNGIDNGDNDSVENGDIT